MEGGDFSCNTIVIASLVSSVIRAQGLGGRCFQLLLFFGDRDLLFLDLDLEVSVEEVVRSSEEVISLVELFDLRVFFVLVEGVTSSPGRGTIEGGKWSKKKKK